jgi:REP element-mobilizing transposase RayT
MNEPFLKGYYYHIFNRGIDGLNIFYSQANYIYLLKKIKTSVQDYGVSLIAYSLMPNHYHFLALQETDRPLSEWIQWLFNGYGQAMNKQLNRCGTLFQGRAKHILIDKEAYLIHLVRYIHYNPVAANLVNSVEKWAYSNYLEWIEKRKGTLVNMPFIRSYFSTSKEYQEFIEKYAIEKKLAEELEKYFLD